MSRITSPAFISERMRVYQYRYYQVYDQDGKTLIDEQQNSDVDLETAINRLESLLNNLEGLVHVKVSKANRQEKGAGGNVQALTYTLQLGGAHMGANKPADNNAGFVQGIGAIRESMEQSFQAKLDAMQKDWEHREEVRRLNERITGLETALKEKDPMTEAGMQMLQQFGPAILGSMFGKPAAPMIHGPGTETAADDIDTRAENALVRLLKVDPDFITNLEKLADLAETNPAMYQMAVSFLNQPPQNNG